MNGAESLTGVIYGSITGENLVSMSAGALTAVCRMLERYYRTRVPL